MSASGLKVLLDSLDEHVAVMTHIVACAQAQQRSVIAFDMVELASSTEAMRHHCASMERAERRTLDAAREVARSLDLSPKTAPTLTALADHLPQVEGAALTQRTSKLRALGGALQELAAMTSVQAERGLTTVRAYVAMLTPEGEHARTYTPRGKARVQPARAHRLSGSA